MGLTGLNNAEWCCLGCAVLGGCIISPFLFVSLLCRFAFREAKLFYRSIRSVCRRNVQLPWPEHARLKSAKHNSGNCHFLRLPAELRDTIYTLALPEHGVLEPVARRYYHLVLSKGSISGSGTTTPLRLECYPAGHHFLHSYLPACKSSPEEWSRISNTTQVCQVMRKESLLLFYERMSFAFEQRRSYHDRKFWSEVKRPKPKFLEHWLQSRPSEVVPSLKVMFKFNARKCSHEWEIKAAMYGTPEDPRAIGVEETITVNDDALVLLDFADSRNLRLVSGVPIAEGHLTIADCEACWKSVTEKWQRLADSEEWSRARGQWLDRADAGKLEWTDASRMVDLVRNHR